LSLHLRFVILEFIATKIKGKYWMYYTHNCLVATSDDLIHWTPMINIVKNDFVDVCIDNRRTIINRFSDTLEGDRLFLFARNGDVTFGDIQIRPLI